MSVQWFPGHMYKAKKAIEERLSKIDLVVEVLDARLPASCVSPLLNELSINKHKLKILNKKDLADDKETVKWLDYFHAMNKTAAITSSANISIKKSELIIACRQLVPHRKGLEKPLRVMICGVPNVGKSTLINQLNGKRVAKTGDIAGVTKQEQRIIIQDDFWLYDTPGMLWQKIIIPESGYRLAIAGSVGKNAYDDEEVAVELLSYLKDSYRDHLVQRYKIQIDDEITAEKLLEEIAKKRGAILSGHRIDYQKVSELVLHDFRSGSLGRVTLETPILFQQWEKTAIEEEKIREIKIKERRRMKNILEEKEDQE